MPEHPAAPVRQSRHLLLRIVPIHGHCAELLRVFHGRIEPKNLGQHAALFLPVPPASIDPGQFHIVAFPKYIHGQQPFIVLLLPGQGCLVFLQFRNGLTQLLLRKGFGRLGCCGGRFRLHWQYLLRFRRGLPTGSQACQQEKSETNGEIKLIFSHRYLIFAILKYKIPLLVSSH